MAMKTAFGGRPITTVGGAQIGGFGREMAIGTFTTTIYTLIKEQKWDEVIGILQGELENFPRSRAALSLLAFSFYHKEDYLSSATMYENLTKVCPDVEEYKIYYAQALYKSGQYQEALKVASIIEKEAWAQRMHMLRASIKYESDDLPGCKSHLDKCLPEEPDVIVLQACVLYKEFKYEDACALFITAMNALGFRADLAYNIALCHYQTHQYAPSLKNIAEIIERGIREHPELSIGSNTEGLEVRSVGNSPLLRETALVEAFNLKAAIEFVMKNFNAAREALSDMPPRSELELDSVTLHNYALMNMDEDPTSGFEKLRFLLQSGSKFPQEAFQNLLILYLKYDYFELAADVLAENSHLTFKYLSADLYSYLDARITCRSSPAEAYRKFDILATKHIDVLRKLTKQIQDEKVHGNAEAVKKTLREYDVALERYIPVLMAMANIYWEEEHYQMVEKIFHQSAEFASDHDTWKLNVAHTFYMQETKFKECIRYYDPIVEKYFDNLLSCSAIVLANLCVSWVMSSDNEKAEELMRRVEREEEQVQQKDPDKQPLHLCIINLVIGTLYCAKGNFEFGISRVIKAMEPYNKKIMPDTWFYAKRCFLALGETLAKHMIMLKDATILEIIAFFDAADIHGKLLPARIIMDPMAQNHSARNTIQYEARVLKKLFLRLAE